ncbi:hypothetical protein REPUB_Repub16aG0070700 [Reevesia pubescens]
MEGCHNLNCLFSSSMVECFVQLKMLNIENCENMEKVIFIEELAIEENNEQEIVPQTRIVVAQILSQTDKILRMKLL